MKQCATQGRKELAMDVLVGLVYKGTKLLGTKYDPSNTQLFNTLTKLSSRVNSNTCLYSHKIRTGKDYNTIRYWIGCSRYQVPNPRSHSYVKGCIKICSSSPSLLCYYYRNYSQMCTDWNQEPLRRVITLVAVLHQAPLPISREWHMQALRLH